MQVVICHGALDALLSISHSDKPIASIKKQPNPDGSIFFTLNWDASSSAKDYLDINGGGTYYPGKENLLTTSPGLTRYDWKALGLPGGSGPALNGVAYVLFSDLYFTTPYIGPVGFDVKRIHTRNGGNDTQWYDSKAEINASSFARADVWEYKLQDKSDTSDWSGITFGDPWATGPGGIGNAPVGADLTRDYGTNYPVPPVGTQLPVDGTLIKGTYPNNWVKPGTKLWLRKDMGKLPVYPLTVKCWHDDSAKLWFNGHEIPLTPTTVPNQDEYKHFNSMAIIPKEYINTWFGGNHIAYRVTDSYDQSGNRIGTNKFIYAGIQVGADDERPAGAADMNFAHMIREALTDTVWGMGNPESDLDDTAFRAAADTLYDEGLGGSFVLAQQMPVEDFLNDALRHISGVLYVDPLTGLIVLKLIRADYVVGDLLVLDESNISKIEEASRKQVGELVNTVTVTYSATMRGDQGSITLYDEGVVQSQGGTVSAKIDYPAITTPVNAAKLALRDLRLLSSPLLACKFIADRAAADLYIGKPFVLNWPDLGINNFVMRVNEIDIGNGINDEVKVSCLEDVFFFPSETGVVTGNGPISFPPVVEPLGDFAGTDTYFTEGLIDTRNKGMVEILYGETALDTPNSPFEDAAGFPGWTEGPAGTMTCNIAGPLLSGLTDGVDPYEGYSGTGPYRSWLEGKRLIVAKVNTTYPTYTDQEKTGIYILDKAGGYRDDAGNFVAEYAQMHRDPSYGASIDYKKDMAFQVRNGTRFGGHFIQLNTDNAVLGSTALSWSNVGTTFSFLDAYELLRGDQIATAGVSPDSTLEVTTTAIAGSSPHDFQAFPALVGSFPSGYIPAGAWRFFPPPCYITGASPGSVTNIGFKIFQSRTSGSATLFEVLTEAIDWTTFNTPADIIYSGAQFPIADTDQIVLIPTIHTTSTTLITVHMRYNAANAMRVIIPKSITNGQTSSALDESYFPVTIDANGAISGFGSHRNLLVSGAGPLISIDTTGLVGGVTLDLTFKDATTVTGNGTPVTGAKIFTTRDADGNYMDLAAPVNALLSVKLRSDAGTEAFWQYVGGNSL